MADEFDGNLRLIYNLTKNDPELFRKAFLEMYPDFQYGPKIEALRLNWMANSSNNRVGAALIKERDLESLPIVPNRQNVWNESRTAPPFLVPKNEENADIINSILMKSMEVQASHCPDGPDDYIQDRSCFKVHGFLMRYFNCIPGKSVEILYRQLEN